jgi:pyrroloquinoline quinone biosynthesis protein B
MRVKVLGSAAGGGFPQWNCGCSNCSRLRAGTLRGRPRTQTQVAVSGSQSAWFLLNASPDLRQQILRDPEFAPSNGSRGTPIAGIILTSADVDSVIGLLHLREFQPLRVFATTSVKKILTQENSIFRALERSVPPIEWIPLFLNAAISLNRECGGGPDAMLSCRAIPLGADFPDYATQSLRRDLSEGEAVVALEITQGAKRFCFAPSIPELTKECKRAIAASDLAMVDGTFWTDYELASVTTTGKTARQIGHVPLSGENGLLDQLRSVQGPRRVLIHINNTNPVLDEESAATQAVRDAGWELAHDEMEFEL